MEFYNVFYRSLDADREKWNVKPLTLVEMFQNYRLVSVGIQAEDLEDLFYKMNMTDWNHGHEVRDVQGGGRVGHTSMSVGDIVVDSLGKMWVCAEFGWQEFEF